MSDETSADDRRATPPADPAGPPLLKRLAVPLLVAMLVGTNAAMAGFVLSSLNRIQTQVGAARDVTAAPSPAAPTQTAAAQPQDGAVEVAVEESAPQPAASFEPTPDTAVSPDRGVSGANESGDRYASRRMLAEHLLLMDAKKSTASSIAIALVEHADLDRREANDPQPRRATTAPAPAQDRLKLAVEASGKQTRVSLRSRARAGAVFEGLAKQLGLQLHLSPDLPEGWADQSVRVSLTKRPLRRTLQALELALDVEIRAGQEALTVDAGPATPAQLRARSIQTYQWVLEDYGKLPPASRAYLGMAVARKEAGDSKGVMAALRELILVWPESRAAAVARLRLGKLLLEGGGNHARRFLFELMGDPLAPIEERSEAALLVGRSYLKQRDFQGAERSLAFAAQLAGSIEPELGERARAYQAAVLLSRGKLTQAVDTARPLFQAVDDEARRVAAETMARGELGRDRPAAAALAAAYWVKALPPKKRTDALGTLGLALRRSGRPISALAMFRLARLERGPDSRRYVPHEADLLTGLGRWEEAKSILQDALAKAGDAGERHAVNAIRMTLAEVMMHLAGPTQARPILAPVAVDGSATPTQRARAYTRLAEIALRADDVEEALAYYTSLASDATAPRKARRAALNERMKLLLINGKRGAAVLAARGFPHTRDRKEGGR